MGRACPSSDLFSLGATVLNLMTDIEPSNLALDDFSFRLTEVDATPEFRDYLRRLTHPSPARRYHDTRRALEALSLTRADVLHVARDEHMIVERRGDGNVILEIPRTYESSPMPVIILLIVSIFVIAATLLNLASVPFWSLVLGGTAIATWTIAARRYFSMNHEGIVWHHGVGPLGFTTRLNTEEILDVRTHSEAASATEIVSPSLTTPAGLFFQKRDGEQLIVWTRADSETNEALAETIMRHLESVR